MQRQFMRESRSRLTGLQRNTGFTRAGMHQKTEHDFMRSGMAASAVTGLSGGFSEETADEALDIPETLEKKIPPEELTESSSAEEQAEGQAFIMPDAGILEKVSDPEMAENEALESPNVIDTARFAVDYAAERVPVLNPVSGGTDCGPRELVYSSGDGSPKIIELPAAEQSEAVPFFPETEDPSANDPEIPEEPEENMDPAV